MMTKTLDGELTSDILARYTNGMTGHRVDVEMVLTNMIWQYYAQFGSK